MSKGAKYFWLLCFAPNKHQILMIAFLNTQYISQNALFCIIDEDSCNMHVVEIKKTMAILITISNDLF